AIGGFSTFKDALIDDWALAARVKRAGFRTWIALTTSAESLRAYSRLVDIWAMVERTAYTQLDYSIAWLLACTGIMVSAFVLPVIGILYADWLVQALACAALAAMLTSYLPTLRFLGRSSAWALALPIIAMLYLAMTWSSAVRFYRGTRARWKDRVYA